MISERYSKCIILITTYHLSYKTFFEFKSFNSFQLNSRHISCTLSNTCFLTSLDSIRDLNDFSEPFQDVPFTFLFKGYHIKLPLHYYHNIKTTTTNTLVIQSPVPWLLYYGGGLL